MSLIEQTQPHASAPQAPLWEDLQAAMALVSAVGEVPFQRTPPLPLQGP